MKNKLVKIIALSLLLIIAMGNSNIKSTSAAPFVLATTMLFSEGAINLPMDAKRLWQGKYLKKESCLKQRLASATCLFLSCFTFSQLSNVDSYLPYNALEKFDDETLFWLSLFIGCGYFTLRTADHIGEWYKTYRYLTSKDSYLNHNLPQDEKEEE